MSLPITERKDDTMAILDWCAYTIGVEICAVVLCVVICRLIKVFLPKLYVRHVAADVSDILSSRCFVCNAESCMDCLALSRSSEK
jgi:hypothetical protein